MSICIFPGAMKLLLVNSLFKKSDSKDLANYRPISSITSLSRVFEKVIYKKLYSYMNNNNILSEN